MRQTACLVICPITVDNFAALFNCMPVDRAADSTRHKAIYFSWLGPELFRLLLGLPGSTDNYILLQISMVLSRKKLYLLSPRLCFIVLNRDLFVYPDDSLTS